MKQVFRVVTLQLLKYVHNIYTLKAEKGYKPPLTGICGPPSSLIIGGLLLHEFTKCQLQCFACDVPARRLVCMYFHQRGSNRIGNILEYGFVC